MSVYPNVADSSTNVSSRSRMRETLIGHKAQRALAFQNVAVRRLGPAAGIFARQLLFWDGKGKDQEGNNSEGWVYKSHAEWQEETGLSRRQQEKARQVLVGKGLMDEEKRKRRDRRLGWYFRLRLDALMDLLGPDLAPKDETLNSRFTLSGISEQGLCPVISSTDYAQYSEQGNTREYVREKPQKLLRRGEQSPPGQEFKDSSPAGAGRSSDKVSDSSSKGDPGAGMSAKGCVAKLISALDAQGDYLEEGEAERYGRNFKRFIEKRQPSEDYLDEMIETIADEWSRLHLSPQQAHTNLQGGNLRSSQGSPPAVIEAIANFKGKMGDTHLREYVDVARDWDFTSEERPPWPILSRLGNSDEERETYLRRLRKVASRAMKGEG